jgi:plastocyanin
MRKVLGAAAAVVLVSALTASAPAGTPPIKHASVDVDGYALSPATIKVKRGTQVVWKWFDGSDVRHDIRVLRGPTKFKSKLIAKGTYTHLFTKPGKYVLYCSVHPQIMRETVIVK